MNVDIKSVSHDSFGRQHLLNILVVSHCIGTQVKSCTECVQQAVMGD